MALIAQRGGRLTRAWHLTNIRPVVLVRQGVAVIAFLSKERTIAGPGYSRWLIPPAALMVHLSIGEVYAFSVFKNPLVERFGVGLTPIAIIFSISIVMLGLSAAVFGTWVERAGPRAAMFTAALCWSGGFAIGALGVATSQLWLVYLGYGVVGGIGLGIGYISPVSTLIKWFPDRPGLATGLAIMGFGGGALIASPLSSTLLETYASNPVNAIVPSFLTLGAIYLVSMMLGAFVVRLPPEGWQPEGWTPPDEDEVGSMQTTADVSAASAIRTPQFWLLWTVLFCNVTAGIGLLEQASPMIQDYFPVAAAAAAGFVGLLSLANMSGRIGWSSTSDYIGRKPTYMMYLGVGALLYFVLASFGAASLVLFLLVTVVILSFYGGGFATVPAYLKDLFGVAEVGAIHGRLLTAWSAAGVAGPLIINAIADYQISAGRTGADLYTLSLYIMVGVLVVGFTANLLVRPVDPRFHMEPEPEDEREGSTVSGSAAGSEGGAS
jgi:MFS family permease